MRRRVWFSMMAVAVTADSMMSSAAPVTAIAIVEGPICDGDTTILGSGIMVTALMAVKW